MEQQGSLNSVFIHLQSNALPLQSGSTAKAARSPVRSTARRASVVSCRGHGDAERSLATSAMKCRNSLGALLVAAAGLGGVGLTPAPRAHAAPAPEVEYVYNVAVRRHYNFPNNDAIGYGYGICDKLAQGESYGQIMVDVKRDVTPNAEFAANFLVSYAVNILCPAQIWQLRNSAAGYVPPAE
jgi:Protein of unknown function (DUF732)